MLVRHALSIGPEHAMRLAIQTVNSGITEFERSAETLRLLAFNGVPHLSQDEVTPI